VFHLNFEFVHVKSFELKKPGDVFNNLKIPYVAALTYDAERVSVGLADCQISLNNEHHSRDCRPRTQNNVVWLVGPRKKIDYDFIDE
jgi:hypothetical protein